MKRYIFSGLLALLFMSSCVSQHDKVDVQLEVDPQLKVLTIDEYLTRLEKNYEELGQAVFAGGCFWCTEASFEQIEGVVDVVSGYSGGDGAKPNYQSVSSGRTDYAEAIVVYYDTEKISYEKLLEIFFVAHDPTTLNKQGPDVGPQYRSGIYYQTDVERNAAYAIIDKLNKSGKFASLIVTEVEKYDEFYTAEGYHQNYYLLNPYNRYIQAVSRPKVEKVAEVFADILKKKS